jgi:cation:H+ antiporter
MTATLAVFVLGLGLLVVGAEALIRGSSRLAAALGIPPLIIGLTVVALGTSAPELAVTLEAALSSDGAADIALGNVVGSNIFNVLFILGLSALLAPLVVAQQLVRVDVPIMIAASALVLVLAADGRLGRADGLLLLCGIAAYLTFVVWQARRERDRTVQREYEAEYGAKAGTAGQVALNLALVAGGLGLLVVGAGWLVDGAVAIARALGLSELVIGLTIVAAGTSLPEVATSVLASLRGERDIAVGNVVGSNLFNVLLVLGGAASLSTTGVNVAPAALAFDIPVMVVVAVACLPIFFTGYRIGRWEGLLFLGYYVAYTAFLLMAATQHDALTLFSDVMMLFALPLTVVTLTVGAYRHWRRP